MSNLPPLPTPDIWVREDFGLGDFTTHIGYSEDQLRSYAEEAVRLALEAAAQVCEGKRGLAPPHTNVHDSACDDCAAAIRARSQEG